MRHYYCSAFSKAYAYKGLLLYNSLQRWDQDFHLYMICLLQEVEELFHKMNLENATIISLSAIEKQDADLLAVKACRNEKEYAWTAKASVMLYIFANYQEIDHLVWLDGDTFFFSDPEPIFREWGSRSIALTEEKWSEANKQRRYTRGIYNTGFMGFKRDDNARQCLVWFREKLIQWCYDRLENGLWSDQLYVNDWPTRFNGVGVITHMGVNAGPCIVRDCQAAKRNNCIYLNGKKLIFFHYYGFRFYDGIEFDLCSYIISFADEVLKWIYIPYIYSCIEIIEQIRQVSKNFYPTAKPSQHFINNYFNLPVNTKGATQPVQICTLFTKNYLVQGLTLYNSLKKTSGDFHLWVLCVDTEAYSLLARMNLKNVTLISVENVMEQRLKAIQGQRKIHEFCWTLKASFVHYLMKNNYNLESILYVDADLFFFQDVRSIYHEWGNRSVFLTKLRLGPKWAQKVGMFSAGLIGFKRHRSGMKCLRSWRRKCREWCFEHPENGRWADQKYLDQWPKLSSSISISENRGINAGPWNIRKGCLVEEKDGTITVDNDVLICYHFSGFEILKEREFELCNRKRLPEYADKIYHPYLKEIRETIKQVMAIDENFLPSINKNIEPERLLNYCILEAQGGGAHEEKGKPK